MAGSAWNAWSAMEEMVMERSDWGDMFFLFYCYMWARGLGSLLLVVGTFSSARLRGWVSFPDFHFYCFSMRDLR